MPKRVHHALRFAVATLLTVYAVGVTWEVVDVYLLGDVADGLDALATLRFNEEVWRGIAAIEAAVVFLLRLGDIDVELPTWPFAFAVALWLGVASVACGYAVEQGRWTLAVAIGLTTVAVWLVLHRHLPGWPHAAARRIAGVGREREAMPESERDLR